MVVRPESPVNILQTDDEWFKEYIWMNEQENFEEEFLDSLHLEELKEVAQAIEDELVETELIGNVNNMRLSDSSDINSSHSPNGNESALRNMDILTSSNLNPNAAEFVPSFVRSR